MLKMNRDSPPGLKKKKKKLDAIKKQMKYMSKDAVRAVLLKKKKCNDRAIEIVNLLIEPNITEEFLLNCLFEINQTHFDDVVEERAIQKVCGYPLCGRLLTNVPQKQFHISTKTNKVYDITERKNFCSNLCYKAGKYLKDQLYTSPLWLREHEDHVVFKLLPLTVNSGSSGEEVDLGNSRITLDDTGSRSCNDDASIPGCDEEYKETVVTTTEHFANELLVKEEMICDGNEQTAATSDDLLTRLEAMDLAEEMEQMASENSNIKIIRESVSQEESPIKVEITSQENKQARSRQARTSKKALSPKDIVVKIENIMRSWFTFETFCCLLGEEKVRQELDRFGLQLQRQDSDPYLYDRYADLCKRLNLLELEETYGPKEVEQPKNPLPDFNKLKEESKKLEIKVKSFFKGDIEFVAEEQPMPPDEALPVLPPLDHHATKAARRRIFLQKLCQSLPDIQEALGLTMTNISEQMKEFVITLNLTAQNICLKPSEWNIVAIVLIKLLSLKDHSLKGGLSSKKASNYLELILMSYNLDSEYLDRLVCWLLDLNYLINSNEL